MADDAEKDELRPPHMSSSAPDAPEVPPDGPPMMRRFASSEATNFHVSATMGSDAIAAATMGSDPTATATMGSDTPELRPPMQRSRRYEASPSSVLLQGLRSDLRHQAPSPAPAPAPAHTLAQSMADTVPLIEGRSMLFGMLPTAVSEDTPPPPPIRTYAASIHAAPTTHDHQPLPDLRPSGAMPGSGSLLGLLAQLLNELDGGRAGVFDPLEQASADEVVLHVLRHGIVDTTDDIAPPVPNLRLLVRIMTDWDALEHEIDLARESSNANYPDRPFFRVDHAAVRPDMTPHSGAIIWLIKHGVIMTGNLSSCLYGRVPNDGAVVGFSMVQADEIAEDLVHEFSCL
jgi:hypothetical protein